MRVALVLLSLVGCEDITPSGGGGGKLTVGSHDCVGSRVDGLWVDADGTIWVGCGDSAEGKGLYRSADRGDTWEAVDGFSSFRVSHIHRSADDHLYVAGIEVGGSDRVRRITATATEPVLRSHSQLWNTFHVGSFARQASGFSMAESLTGTGVAYRSSDDEAFMDGSHWTSGSYQILDLVDHGGTLVGVGSTIASPPVVFVQQEGLAFSTTELDTYDGELWSVDSDGAGLVAGGVDQDAHQAMVFTATDPSGAWQRFRLESETPTWVRGVCREGDWVVAVGEYSITRKGLWLESTDGGVSFEERELPENTPALSSCQIRDRALTVVGSQGWFAIE